MCKARWVNMCVHVVRDGPQWGKFKGQDHPVEDAGREWKLKGKKEKCSRLRAGACKGSREQALLEFLKHGGGEKTLGLFKRKQQPPHLHKSDGAGLMCALDEAQVAGWNRDG